MHRRIIVAISGSSGVVYGLRLLECLRALGTHEVHLIVSAAAERTLAIETPDRASGEVLPVVATAAGRST